LRGEAIYPKTKICHTSGGWGVGVSVGNSSTGVKVAVAGSIVAEGVSVGVGVAGRQATSRQREVSRERRE